MQDNPRRAFISAGSAGLAISACLSAWGQGRRHLDETVAELVGRSAYAHAALVRGDIDTYRALITLSEDFTLMSPFGGAPSRATDITGESWESMRRFFANGTLKQELVQAYGSEDMVVLAIIEHGHGEVGGLPAQDWPLRVTLVFRREESGWLLAHRHADPLVRSITVEQSAALARGSIDWRQSDAQAGSSHAG